MGRTIPSFRLACIAEELRWHKFRSRLSKDDKKNSMRCFRPLASIIAPVQIPLDQ